jgi:hypothetical protein
VSRRASDIEKLLDLMDDKKMELKIGLHIRCREGAEDARNLERIRLEESGMLTGRQWYPKLFGTANPTCKKDGIKNYTIWVSP